MEHRPLGGVHHQSSPTVLYQAFSILHSVCSVFKPFVLNDMTLSTKVPHEYCNISKFFNALGTFCIAVVFLYKKEYGHKGKNYQ